MSSGERPIDVVYGLKPGSLEPKHQSPLDVAIAERNRRLAQESQEMQLRKINLQDKADLLKTEKEVSDLERGLTPFKSGSESNESPELAFVNNLIKQGWEAEKAVNTVKSMDPSTRLALWQMAQTQGGAQFMMPYFLAASRPGNSMQETLEILKTAKTMFQQQGQQESQLDTLIKFNQLVRPNEEQNRVTSNLYARTDKLENDLTTEREERHRLEVKHSEEMASVRQKNLEEQIRQINDKLDKKSAGEKDTLSLFKKTVTDLQEIGLPIKVGESAVKSPLEEAGEVVDRVIASPGVTGLFNAMGDRVRSGGGLRGPPAATAQMARQPSSGMVPNNVIFCDNCLASGRRTLLTITPGVIAGVETVKCPTCSMEFIGRRGPAPGAQAQQPGPSGPSQPPPGPGQQGQPGPPPGGPPGSDNRPFFPGRF